MVLALFVFGSVLALGVAVLHNNALFFVIVGKLRVLLAFVFFVKEIRGRQHFCVFLFSPLLLLATALASIASLVMVLGRLVLALGG